MPARLLDLLFTRIPITPNGYQILSVASQFGSKDAAHVPLELRILFTQNGAYRSEIEKLLDLGYVIEIHRLIRIPEEIRQAVKVIACMSQEETFGPWLSRLLHEGDRPTFTEREVEAAKRQNISLYAEVDRIFAQRHAYKRLVLQDPQQIGIDASQRDFFVRLNEALSAHVLEYGKRRLLASVSISRTRSWIQFLLLFLFAGAIVHVFGQSFGVLAYLSAFVLGGMYEEGREIWALHRAGYAGRSLSRRTAGLIFFFLMACVVAWLIQRLVEQGFLGLGGFVFGVAVSVLPAVFFLRALRGIRERLVSLKKAGKLHPSERLGWGLVLKEYGLHPAKMAALVTLGFIPFLSFLVFRVFPQHVHNGWLLMFMLFLELFVMKIGIALFAVWPCLKGVGRTRFFA